jgi:hypothetical protein
LNQLGFAEIKPLYRYSSREAENFVTRLGQRPAQYRGPFLMTGALQMLDVESYAHFPQFRGADTGSD